MTFLPTIIEWLIPYIFGFLLGLGVGVIFFYKTPEDYNG